MAALGRSLLSRARPLAPYMYRRFRTLPPCPSLAARAMCAGGSCACERRLAADQLPDPRPTGYCGAGCACVDVCSRHAAAKLAGNVLSEIKEEARESLRRGCPPMCGCFEVCMKAHDEVDPKTARRLEFKRQQRGDQGQAAEDCVTGLVLGFGVVLVALF